VTDTGFARIKSSLEAAARLHQSGQRARAIEIYRALLAEAPRLPPLLNLLGLALVQDGNVDQGLRYLSKAVRLAPDFAEAWLNLAFARYEAEDRDGAVDAYRQVLKLQPNHLTALLSFASLTGETDTTEAVTLLRRAVQVAPDRALPWLRLRRACLFLGDLAGVAETERQIAQVGLKTAEELVEGGHIELMQGRPGEAIARFAGARKLQPGSAVAALGLGEALLLNRDFPAALREFNEAAALAPRRSSTWIGIGRALLAMGNREEAAYAFRQALDREEGDVQRHLLSAALGQPTAATPADYLKWHYNPRAASYEAKLRALGYDLPEQVGALLRALHPGRFANALDLGCGTGLTGAVLRPLASRMVGLDASLAMLNMARATRRYDDLIEQEALSYLAGTRELFDLIVAADVLIHVGDLAPVFREIAEHLQPSGLFIATFEHPKNAVGDADSVLLGMTATFTHGEGHVRAAAGAAGLQAVHWAAVALPRESGPAPGTLAAFRLPA
jgi:predicted TPR repeat methyltransferase